MDGKQSLKISGGIASLLDGAAVVTETPEEPVRATEETATPEEEEELLNAVEDEELRDALRARRMLRRGRPRKENPLTSREGDLFSRATLILRKEYHTKLREICLRETLTFKEVMDAMIREGLRAYESTHGEITPKERRSGDASTLFVFGK